MKWIAWNKCWNSKYLLAVDLRRYKWYQRQTSDYVPTFSLCVSKDTGPQRRVDLGAVPHRCEEGKSPSEDIEPRRGVDCDVLHWLERRTNTIYKGVETFHWGKGWKEKPKEDNIAVDVERYNFMKANFHAIKMILNN